MVMGSSCGKMVGGAMVAARCDGDTGGGYKGGVMVAMVAVIGAVAMPGAW